MIDTHTSARWLTERGLPRRLVGAMTDARPEVAEHGDHVTAKGLRAELGSLEARQMSNHFRADRRDPRAAYSLCSA